jgi:hypothetical protein
MRGRALEGQAAHIFALKPLSNRDLRKKGVILGLMRPIKSLISTLGPWLGAIVVMLFFFTFAKRSRHWLEMWSGRTNSSFIMFWNNSSLYRLNKLSYLSSA